MTGVKAPWGSGIQTPSYILSPLDSGPQKLSLECPISFSPFLPFGAFGNTAGNGGVFFISFVISFEKRKIIPNANCQQTDPLGATLLTRNHRVII